MSKASEIAEFIKAHDNFLIAAHVFPDGDNLGSLLAIRECLETIGRKHSCYIHNTLPHMYQWLPGADLISPNLDDALSRLDDPDNPTLFILDSGDFDRVGDEFTHWLKQHPNLTVINVDHHVSNTQFGTVNWVGPDYSSTGEMVIEIVDALGLEFTESMAKNLFVAIYTDTGKFSFSNTTERSFRYAARMVNAGAKPIEAFRQVYASRSFASFKLQTLSFQTLTNFLDGKGCYFYVSRPMLEETGTTMDETEGFIDTIRTLEGFSIVVFFKERADDDIRVSVRAMPPINASKLMALFGGGGHPRAAGCRIDMPLPDAVTHFVTIAEKAINAGDVMESD